MIDIRNITKTYPGSQKKANNNISMQINKGEILCVAGENGAGKTTLMKILSGLVKPDAGEIIFKEKTNIGMVHQHFLLFPEYTAAQNIVMAEPPLKWGIFFDNKKANASAQKIIDENNFFIKPAQKVKDLTLGQMQQTEICRVLFQNADLIILDEPTAVLTDNETLSLFKTMKQLVKNGKTIIFITHKMKEITQISDRVVVLHKGEIINNLTQSTQSTRSCEENKKEKLSTLHSSAVSASLREDIIPVIEFQNVTIKRRGQKLPLLDNVSFAAHAGEILGITGTGGNGLGAIEAALGGFLHPAKGRVLHNGKDVSGYSIRKLRKNGLAFVPADRKKYGSSGGASIEENLIINRRDEFYKCGVLNKKKAREFAENLLREYNIMGNAEQKARELSGGNLQKAILAREINCIKDYIVFSEPSWGLDFASSNFIMNEILKLKEKGKAVVLISTNADEVYSLADRVIVMNKGRIAGIRDRGAGNSEK